VPAVEQRHRYADHGQRPSEVPGPVEGVDCPPRTGQCAATLLGQDRDLRRAPEENFDDGIFTGVIGIGDIVARGLLQLGEAVSEAGPPQDRRPGASGLERDV
jgi:hypothetical protein